MILVWQPDKWNFVCVCVDHCGTLLVSRSSRCWPMTSHDHICTLGPFGQSGCSDSGHVRSRCGQAYWGESALSPLWNDYEDQMIKDRYEGLWRHCFFRTKGSKLRMKHGKARRIPVRLRVSESCVSFLCYPGSPCLLRRRTVGIFVGTWAKLLSWWMEVTLQQPRRNLASAQKRCGDGWNPLLPYVLGNKHLLTRLTSYLGYLGYDSDSYPWGCCLVWSCSHFINIEIFDASQGRRVPPDSFQQVEKLFVTVASCSCCPCSPRGTIGDDWRVWYRLFVLARFLLWERCSFYPSRHCFSTSRYKMTKVEDSIRALQYAWFMKAVFLESEVCAWSPQPGTIKRTGQAVHSSLITGMSNTATPVFSLSNWTISWVWLNLRSWNDGEVWGSMGNMMTHLIFT